MSATKKALRSKARHCDHYWFYKHAIWQSRKDDQSCVAVGRYCTSCGTMQTAVASNWHPLPKSYVDMRETLQAAIKDK